MVLYTRLELYELRNLGQYMHILEVIEHKGHTVSSS